MIAPLLLALFLVVPAGSAAADPYAPQIPTRTTITVVVGEKGDPIALAVRVTANAKKQPKGTIELSLRTTAPTALGAQAAGGVWNTTASYDGGRLVLEGPVAQEGVYVANAAFTPDGQTFLPSEGANRFTVGDGSGEGDGEGGDEGGLLPNTGGPNLLWLLLGTALVGGGAGTVVYARRRQATAAPAA